MDNRKIYAYHKLEPLDIMDSIDWARENYHRFGGETSALWNEHVQNEFARLTKQYSLWGDCWESAFKTIALDIALLNSLGITENIVLVEETN